jgi:uncharacterized protein
MNKATVAQYMQAFREADRAAILGCLTDDVVWRIPGFFESSGKAEFAKHIVDEGFTGTPQISVSRLTEENDVAVAEGTVRAQKTDGTVLDLAFCDVFEMRNTKIAGLTSYLVTVSQPLP